MKTLFTYLLFGGLSAGLHAWLLLGNRAASPPAPETPPAAVLTVETAAVPVPEPEPTPEPTPEPKEDPTPPLFREAEQEDPEVKTPDRSEKETTKEPEPREEKPVAKLSDYRAYLEREMPKGGTSYPYVPKIRFGDNTETENREIMRYFGMELIAYPKDRSYYVYLDPAQGLASKSTDFEYLKNFSNRVIFRESAFFRSLRDLAAKTAGVAPEELVVAQLLKSATARYIEWKQKSAAEAAKIALEEVVTCEATFVRIPTGVWIARIDAMILKDGRRIEARDPEWEKWK